MAQQQNFRIAGTGSYLPKKELSSEMVDQRLGKPSGWTRKRVGVETRYECALPETLVSMGKLAIERAMEDAGLNWSEIDYIIDCSTCQFRPVPNNACHFQNAIGNEAQSVPCMAVQSTCLGSMLAVNVANGLFSLGGTYRNILLVASESGLAAMDWQEPESAALIGDGAAAMVLQYAPEYGRMAFMHETFSSHLDLCRVDGGGHFLPSYFYQEDRKRDYLFKMQGPSIFKVAMKRLPPMVQKLRDDFDAGGHRGNIHVVPHQASPRAVQILKRMLGLPNEQYHVMVSDVGNMAAASIPFVFDQVRRKSLIDCGDTVMFLGTSAGYSQAGMIFQA